MPIASGHNPQTSEDLISLWLQVGREKKESIAIGRLEKYTDQFSFISPLSQLKMETVPVSEIF